MTVEANVGEVAILEALFYDQPGGSLTDPSIVALEVQDINGNVDFGPYTYAGGTITKVSTGFYRKELTIPDGTEPGTYTVKWTAVISGNTEIGYETLVLTELTPTTGANEESIWYCTREDVTRTLDVKTTARSFGQVDQAIEAASRSIESLCHRKFYPLYATKYFDWPNYQYADVFRLWLDGQELISLTSLSIDSEILADDEDLYFLEPADEGPPYDSVELNTGTSAVFSSGSTHQRAIAVTGLFGYTNNESQPATLSENLDSTETAVDVSVGSIGVGSIIRIDSERMIVTGKRFIDTTVNLATPMTASNSNDTVAVADGTLFAIDEVLTLDSERMLIVDIVGNNLIVKRAWDGSTLATHTGSDIYAQRTLDVQRGALGTTAATHASASTVYKYEVPAGIRTLCIAEAISTIQQEQAGYARTIGSGEGQAEASGKGLKQLRQDMKVRYGRQARKAAI